jgi:thiamine biosynthesis lipoprotein
LPVDHPTRRRAIAILAGTAAAMATIRRPAAEVVWEGTAMGADAHIAFCGDDHAGARAAAGVAVAEIERLERALSLFRADSEISRLNRDGALDTPSGDFRRALALALAVAEASGGLFDPTVQALWETHVDWLVYADGLPPELRIAAARVQVDWHRITLGDDAVRLGAGQRVTLNGLGQGYVTDRVADLLRARGFQHVLVDLGEQRAIGPRADGSPWEIARAGAPPLRLATGALATSEAAGCVLGAAGAVHHLFDPRTGRSADHWRRITVHHRSAAVADALSTALYAASSPAEITAVLARLPATVFATDRDGHDHAWSSADGGLV